MMPLRLLLLLVFTSSCQSTLATEEELREILELGGGGDADAAAAAAAAVGAPDNVDIDDDVFGAIAVKPEEGDAFYVGRICAKGWGMEEASSIPSINFFFKTIHPLFPSLPPKKKFSRLLLHAARWASPPRRPSRPWRASRRWTGSFTVRTDIPPT